jgi:hypothetical protein
VQVFYCDLCGTPLKDNNYYMFYISAPRNQSFVDTEEYFNYLRKAEKQVKEVCPSCKSVFDKIFELRIQRLSELTDEIMNIYKLPPKEEKNDKEK